MKLTRIVVAVKPWERGLPLAANHARQLSQSVNAQIELVGTVFDAAVAARRDRGESAARATQARAIATARVELERLALSMRDWGAKITTKVVWGVPAYEGILSAAEESRADLLVVGAHEPDTLHTRLTDTDWQLMRRVSCPLLLVKGPVFNGYRTVVAAVDPLHAHDEPEGLDRAVLDAGRCFARAFGSKLRAVYAYRGAASFDVASAVEVAPGVFYGAENVEALHRRAVTELVAEYGVTGTDVDLVDGDVADAVIDSVANSGAELVVVGAPRRHGLLAAAVGSTAEAVAAAVPCDVLIVPTVGEPRARRGSQVR